MNKAINYWKSAPALTHSTGTVKKTKPKQNIVPPTEEGTHRQTCEVDVRQEISLKEMSINVLNLFCSVSIPVLSLVYSSLVQSRVVLPKTRKESPPNPNTSIPFEHLEEVKRQ